MTRFPRHLWLCILLGLPAPAQADAPAALRQALDFVASEQWDQATAAAQGATDIGADIIEWHRLRAGEGRLGEYEDFIARRADWPGMPLLHEKGEEAAARSTTPERVIAYFSATPPETATGSLALINALAATGRSTDARAEAARAWLVLDYSADQQAQLLAGYAETLAPLHNQRLDMLLWQDRRAEAQLMLPLVSDGQAALARARMALRADADGVDALLSAVPADLQNSAGLAFDRFDWRLRHDKTEGAAEIILAQSRDAASLGDPALWAERRADLARALLRDGQAQLAYQVASSNRMDQGLEYADLEFVAGFAALRFLNDPATALDHFKRLQAAVDTPISLSRALYWQGRALMAAGDQAGGRAAMTQAAQYQSAYYGQMAAETLGLTLDPALLAETRPADWRKARFAKSTVLAAGALLARAGDRTLAKRFFVHLCESLTPDEMAQLADLAREMDEPHIALVVAKQAAEQGVILPAYYFPVPAFIPADNLPVSHALALSIARRESEFDPAARSHADARGLMQVLPGTAKLVAPKVGLAYDASRLNEADYNVRLGTGYLAQMIAEFGPSVALVASGYNAGPARPRRWIGMFGDPRSPDVDVVDWVEMIPFSETRTYVMRVAESLVIYRAKLKGQAGPVRLTAELRG